MFRQGGFPPFLVTTCKGYGEIVIGRNGGEGYTFTYQLSYELGHCYHIIFFVEVDTHFDSPW